MALVTEISSPGQQSNPWRLQPVSLTDPIMLWAFPVSLSWAGLFPFCLLPLYWQLGSGWCLIASRSCAYGKLFGRIEFLTASISNWETLVLLPPSKGGKGELFLYIYFFSSSIRSLAHLTPHKHTLSSSHQYHPHHHNKLWWWLCLKNKEHIDLIMQRNIWMGKIKIQNK